MLITRVIVLCGMFIINQVSASSQLQQDLESDIKRFSNPDGAAHAVLVSRSGEPVFQYVQGFANLELEVKANLDTIFEVGSLTKLFTAVAVLKLAQQNKLNLDTPISKYISGMKSDYYTPTVHHLLAHTSGMVDAINSPEYLRYRVQEPISLQELIDDHKTTNWQFEPGTRINYSNVGYSMLAHVIEQVSGQPYNDYLTTTFFKPLKMESTKQASSAITKRKASGYTFNGDVLRQHDLLNLTWAYGAGDMLSSIADLNVWASALMSEKLLNKHYLNVLTQNIQLADGRSFNSSLNFDNTNIDNRIAYRMNGSTLGFSSHMLYMPSETLFIVVLNNSDGVNGGDWIAPATITSKLAATYLNLPSPDFKIVNVAGSRVNDLVGSYQLKDGTIRKLSFENEQFYYQRGEGTKFQVLPMENDSFYFEDTLSYFQIKKGEAEIRFMDFYYFPDNRPERAVQTDSKS